MISRWAIAIAISFIVRQIEKFGETIDWAKVKADLKPLVEKTVPGTWFDAEAVAAVNALVDVAARALSATADIKRILDLLADEKWAEAVALLKDLILGAWGSPAAGKEAEMAAELALMDANA